MEEIASQSEEELDKTMEELVGVENPLGGTILGASAFITKTKKGGDFTKVVWKAASAIQSKIEDIKKMAEKLAVAQQKTDAVAKAG